VSRILLLLDQRENRTLLEEELARDHEVGTGESAAALERDFDLCILDGHALDRLGERVHERKEAEQPSFLPVLLVTTRPQVRLITRHLWRSVDDLIITPIEKPELRARIEVLLRGRELSLELRRRVAEAEQAIRTRDEVLAMVAHDLRNPLNLVLAGASLLLELGTGLEPKEREQLQVIHRAAGRMNRLIQDLLEVSSAEAGEIAIEPRPQPPALLVREACDLFQHAAAEKTIELTCDAGADLPEVQADHDRIIQVFSNLIGNALKFTPAGGRVVIRAEPDQAAVRFSVADTGPGIPEADLPHIFDRFWQAERSRKGGAGLGLAIARGIITAHGGEIWAESTVGRGSTFSFTLPT
jgi:signal transduction histidine kinase